MKYSYNFSENADYPEFIITIYDDKGEMYNQFQHEMSPELQAKSIEEFEDVDVKREALAHMRNCEAEIAAKAEKDQIKADWEGKLDSYTKKGELLEIPEEELHPPEPIEEKVLDLEN
uniref:Uncharacterized protein n=1 Tax=viral metagenome TaxID=1070528 RepID=A0A6H1ZH24_9ZZZZ